MDKLTILVVLININVYAQKPSKANAFILEYAQKNLGKKVGDGVCRTLTNNAIFEYRKLKNKNVKIRDYARATAGNVITDTSKWAAGDLITFEYVIYQYPDSLYLYMMRHVGIIKSVDKEKVVFYNQNVLSEGETTKKNSVVKEGVMYFNRINTGTIRALRIY